MDTQTIRRLCLLNNGFYRENAASFSETRQHAWPGWERVIANLGEPPATVLDVACGNLRFKSFLEGRGMQPRQIYHAVDSCADLLPGSHDAVFQELDIIDALASNRLQGALEAPACDMCVCFGFMHHVPTTELRARLMEALVAKTQPRGLLAVSFWQFADDPRALKKARATTKAACAELDLMLDDGDYLLGWKEKPGTYRYCHSFTDAELHDLASRCSDCTVVVDRFRADGKTGQMNGYLVLRKS